MTHGFRPSDPESWEELCRLYRSLEEEARRREHWPKGVSIEETPDGYRVQWKRERWALLDMMFGDDLREAHITAHGVRPCGEPLVPYQAVTPERLRSLGMSYTLAAWAYNQVQLLRSGRGFVGDEGDIPEDLLRLRDRT